MTKDEALKMAIEALKNVYVENEQLSFVDNAESNWKARQNAINACKEALEQEQEPVAFVEVTEHHRQFTTSKAILLENGVKLPDKTWLYTHPAKQLSDDEIWEIVNETHLGLSPFEDTFRFARAIEAKIRGD